MPVGNKGLMSVYAGLSAVSELLTSMMVVVEALDGRTPPDSSRVQ